MNKPAKIPYFESLSTLLQDLGLGTDYIIGKKEGKEGIDWIRIHTKNLDKEVTAHSPTPVPLVRTIERPDGTCTFDSPKTNAKEGATYSFINAKFLNDTIIVKCNVMSGENCEIREIPVTELRNELGIKRPSNLRLMLYSR